MYQDFKHWIKSFLTLSKFEQRGIVALLVLLMFVAGLNLLLPSVIHHKEYSNAAFEAEVARFKAARQHLEDSLELVRLQNKKLLTPDQAKARLHPFPFDPNQLTMATGLKLGLTARQVQTIMHYIEKGGRFRKTADFKKMYCLSDAEYKILAPYINIAKTRQTFPQEITLATNSLEINTCDSAQLCNKLHLQSWLAGRIVKYRSLLGNFYSVTQLQEVYGMKETVYQKLKKFLTCDTSLVKKIDLNHATFRTLVHHPYIDYQITKNLVNSRRYLKGFRNLSEIRNVPGISDSLYRKLRHYLYVSPLSN